MLLSDAVRKRITKLLKVNNMNLWKLYKSTGVPMSTLASFMRKDRELLSLKTLLHVCEGFNMSLKEFFDDPLFENVEQD